MKTLRHFSKHLFSLIFLSLILLCSCSFRSVKPPVRGSTEYTHNEPPSGVTVVYTYYIDPTFKQSTKDQIRAACEEWNIALNGYEKFQMGVLGETSQPSPFDYMFVNVKSSEAEEQGLPGGVLAWVDDLGDTTVHVIEDRLFWQDIKVVTAHEIGHSLGLPHILIRGTLMFPRYPNAPCETETDMRELATLYPSHYSIQHLNWCSYKPN